MLRGMVELIDLGTQLRDDGKNIAPGGWLGQAPDIAEDQIKSVLETEMLVIGGGLGGLVCAASGAESGTGTILIEKRHVLTHPKNEFGALGSRLQKAEGIEIDKWELMRDALMYSAGYIDEKLWALWADESGEAIDWLSDRFGEGGSAMWLQSGYEQRSADGIGFTKYLCGHRPKWGKKAGAIILRDYALEHGAQILMNTGLVKLVREGSRVTGCIAWDSAKGEHIKINASKGVVVATGGYGNNIEMLEALQPQTRDVICHTICDGYGMGDGIRACIWAGAKFDDIHSSIVFDRGALRAGETPRTCALDGESNTLNGQPWLKVNLNGERFANESAPYDFILHASSLQPGGCYCVIFDADYESYVERFDMAGCSRIVPFSNDAPTNTNLTELGEKLKQQIADGIYAKADTIEGLAEQLSLPKGNLVRSVERYNELYRLGKDEDFGKLPHQLSQVLKPPFFGCRACGVLLSTVDGIRIDTDMNALDEELNPIPGLYVVGNDSGGFFANTYFSNVTGCAAGRTVTFARRAARCCGGACAVSDCS